MHVGVQVRLSSSKATAVSTCPPGELCISDGRRILIRTIVADDAPALVEYIQSVLVPSEHFVTQADEYHETIDQARERIQQHLDSPGCLILQACCAGRMAGLLVFTCGSLRRISHVGTFHITLHPDFRGLAIGRALLQRLLDWATGNPAIRKVALSVLATNERAIRLYRQFGFIEEGRKIAEVQLGPDNYVDDILMYRLVK